MAGPLSGIGGQQQVPLATPFKPGESNNNQPRETSENTSEKSKVQAQSSDSSFRQDVLRSQQQSASTRHADNADQTPPQPRGSLIDVTV